MEFGERLKCIRFEKGITQQDLANGIKVSVIAIRNWERNISHPSMGALISLAKFFHTSTDNLLGVHIDSLPKNDFILFPAEKKLLNNYRLLDSHGKKVVETICALEKDRIESEEPHFYPDKMQRSERFIPCYVTPSAAGFNAPLDGDDFEMILVDDSIPANADYAVRIQGNSMHPYINDGDIVYVEKTEELLTGDVGIFCVDGAMYCKQYCITNDELVLASANVALKNTNIILRHDDGHSFKCCGKVLLKKRVPIPGYLY